MAKENCTLYRDKFIIDCIENNIGIYHIPNAANANKGFYWEFLKDITGEAQNEKIHWRRQTKRNDKSSI